MFCNNCGKEINDNAKFCSGCGKELVIEKTVTDLGTEKKHRKWPGIVLNVILGLLIISLIGLIFDFISARNTLKERNNHVIVSYYGYTFEVPKTYADSIPDSVKNANISYLEDDNENGISFMCDPATMTSAEFDANAKTVIEDMLVNELGVAKQNMSIVGSVKDFEATNFTVKKATYIGVGYIYMWIDDASGNRFCIIANGPSLSAKDIDAIIQSSEMSR